ncbi:MAG: heme NO-binding domain-containing protein [Flavobacteriaceae bacterium]|nr:heme NO-binding domain-containing protein [Flavobacteriaceae bacterium]
MKGIVFTEFIEMIETEFSLKMADDIIVRSNVESGGAYTSIGVYNHLEIFALVEQLSLATGISKIELFRIYGEHLFGRFKIHYPSLFEKINDSLSFLELVDSYIHKEVLKLYPNAQLPSFLTERISENELKMIYTSKREMSDFAHGLILGCFKNFNEEGEIEVDKVAESKVIFNVKRLK